MESLIIYIPILLIISTLITGLSTNKLNNFYSGLISTSLVFVSLIISLFILFDGCFISMLENRLCNDNFNMIDPFLEFNGLVVDYKSRKALTYYIAVCYTMLFLTIYYVRFRLKVE